MAITLRATKGSALTHNELDANFTTLDTGKLNLSGGNLTGTLGIGLTPTVGLGDLQVSGDAFTTTGWGVGQAGSANLSGRLVNVDNTAKSVALEADPSNVGSGSQLLIKIDGTTQATFNPSNGLLLHPANSEGGQLILQNVANTSAGVTLDVNASDNPRLFSGTNSVPMQIGFLGGTSNFITFHTENTEKLRIGSTGIIESKANVYAYGSGAGGTVTQLTSKTTSVTINKPSGKITTHNASLGAGATAAFQVNNSFVSANSVVVLAISGNGNYTTQCRNVQSGAFFVLITNESGGALAQAVDINFCVMNVATT